MGVFSIIAITLGAVLIGTEFTWQIGVAAFLIGWAIMPYDPTI